MKRFFLIWMLALAALFAAVRVPALSQIYHQDEYKWAQIVDLKYGLAGTLPHPPLVEKIFEGWGSVFGYGHLRSVVLIVAVLNFLLGLALVRRWFGEKSARWFGALSVVMTASIIASVQIDIDGTFLPFWTLLAFWAATDVAEGRKRRGHWILAAAVIGGCLTKLSFILVPVVLLAEWALRCGWKPKLKSMMIGLFLFMMGAVIWNLPFLDRFLIFRYAHSFGFLNLASRDYFELLLLVMKSVVMLGPAVIVAAFAAFYSPSRYRLLILFSAAQLLFYLVLFDFTHRTLERYLLALVFPVAAIAGDALARAFTSGMLKTRWSSIWPTALATILFLVAALFLPKAAIPLQPKAEFVNRLIHGRLNFLIPISGGSGPVGFFVPADVTLIAFVLTVALSWMVLIRRRAWNAVPAVALTTVVFAYAILTSSEFLFGTLYGNATRLAEQAIAHVNANPDIHQIITYNDIGGWELGESGKYFKRFYFDPQFTASNEQKFSSYDGYYLVVNMPPLAPSSPAAQYFQRCKKTFQAQDKKIFADVYDCRGVPYVTPAAP